MYSLKLTDELIENAAGTDDVRRYFNGVFFDAKALKFIATDGYILAHLDVDGADVAQINDSDDHTAPFDCIIPLEAIKEARKRKTNWLEIVENGAVQVRVVDGTTENLSFEAIDERYPAWERAVPKTTGKADVSFSAQLLLDLARALNTKRTKATGKDLGINLTFARDKKGHIDPDGAIEVGTKGNDNLGVLMPMRL